ncbi:MAG TPA: hypothetical protein VI072_19845 [Polyangiaceae bacterium]
MSHARRLSLLLRGGMCLLALLNSGCSFENYGLDYTTVELHARRSDEPSEVPRSAPFCVTLPVLTGSVVQQRFVMYSPLGATVNATSEQVQLRFFGASSPTPPVVVTSDELEGGYETDIALETREGTALIIEVRSPCSPDSQRG